MLALLLLATGSGKLAGAKSSRAIRDSLAVAPPAWRAIGAFEVLLVVGLVAGIWATPLGRAAAAGVVVLMLGAVAARVRAGGAQRNRGVGADAVVLFAAVVVAIA
ncbi:DoxX family protein [Kineococcus sp. DHX-1]|uniref:DoxX family protein n=1 Tax=Kineococcus sp. DHX-1 TaxID=3349638 RepID=UPI0036D2B575